MKITMRLSLVVAVVAMLPLAVQAQSQNDSRAWLAETLSYYGVAKNATAEDLDRLLELKTKTLEPSLSLRERLSVFSEIYTTLARLCGAEDVPQQTVLQSCFGPTILAQALASGGESRPISTTPMPLGRLGPVEKLGTGPVPLVLIADYGTDWTLYREFMERNADRYTMYAVTMPGFGNSAAPPRSATLDVAKTPWFDGVERGVLDLIAKNRIDRPFVLGTQVGAYVAIRLALDHPDRVRGVVALNALVSMPYRTPSNPDAPLTLDARRRLVVTRPEMTGLLSEFLPTAVPSPAAMEKQFDQLPERVRDLLAAFNTRDATRGRGLVVDFYAKADPRVFRYLSELNATDLAEDLGRLSVPLLVIPSLQDDAAPSQDGPGLAQWTEVRLRYPSIPLTVVPFADTRPYAVYDAPEDLDRAVAAFVAGKPVTSGRKHVYMAERARVPESLRCSARPRYAWPMAGRAPKRATFRRDSPHSTATSGEPAQTRRHGSPSARTSSSRDGASRPALTASSRSPARPNGRSSSTAWPTSGARSRTTPNSTRYGSGSGRARPSSRSGSPTDSSRHRRPRRLSSCAGAV